MGELETLVWLMHGVEPKLSEEQEKIVGYAISRALERLSAVSIITLENQVFIAEQIAEMEREDAEAEKRIKARLSKGWPPTRTTD